MIYGITSFFQLGTFLPPIPLNPFVYLLFVCLGIYYGVRSRTSLVSYALLGWLALFAINSHAFLEVVMTTPQLINYEKNVSVFVSLALIFVFLLHSVFLLLAITRQDKRYGVCFIPLFLAITFHFLESTFLSFNVIIIGWATLIFILDRVFGEQLPGLFNLSPILYGAGVIEVVEMVVFLT
jgi:uncharacterized protein YhhL (DUF1145 family)